MIVQGAGVELSVSERGSGPAVLVVHGMASDAAAQEPLVAALADRARVVAYDRRGYGGSTAPEPYEGTTVQEQAEDAAAVLGGLGVDRAVVVGDGFGALVALDLLLRHRGRVAGAVLAEPPLYAFVPEATEALAAQRALLEEHLREGGPPAAVAAWAAGRAADDELARARRCHRAFFADMAGVSTWPVSRRELRAIAVPVAVVTNALSPAHVIAAADALAGVVPGATRRTDGDLAGAAARLLQPA
ncbi:MAG: alpha/beta fold hydrolase [Solirubrobacterales bacterium]|nr:alpha/beta fold hydrolase [Solirubrobacterales bacterium]